MLFLDENNIVELKPQEIKNFLNFVKLQKNDIFYDLGSGTGKVVIKAVEQTPVKKAIGIEILKKFHELARKRSHDRLDMAALRKIDFWLEDYFSQRRIRLCL